MYHAIVSNYRRLSLKKGTFTTLFHMNNQLEQELKKIAIFNPF